MGLWRSIKERLGLADEYDEYDDDYYGEDEDVEGYEPDPDPDLYKSPYGYGDSKAVRRLEREPDLDRARQTASSRGAVAPGPGMQAVPQVKMQITEPRTFGEAQAIADKFKTGVPVIMNLTMTDPDLAKRLLDFASGLTYGLNGGLQKVSDKVFMLTPANVDVTEQRRALREKGLFDLDM
ncbi:MAG: cell division protein SepF [Anaerosomatales bacterium]|nr:cell division protein SepF [Anaerosomatales bacterium]